jgi:hypothetical protein
MMFLQAGVFMVMDGVFRLLLNNVLKEMQKEMLKEMQKKMQKKILKLKRRSRS